jgi:hypothetical protein
VARYCILVGKRIEVHYRSGETVLTANGVLAADSGKSIFLEENVLQLGVAGKFRWEIPYANILQVRPAALPPPAQPASVSPTLAG